MTRTVYVNGEYLPEEEARISVFDRGFLMADAVYEVTAVIGGKLIDFPGHMARLRRSLGELELTAPVDAAEMEEIHREMIARNSLDEGGIYLQVTRGAADRDFAFPENATPSRIKGAVLKALENRWEIGIFAEEFGGGHELSSRIGREAPRIG